MNIVVTSSSKVMQGSAQVHLPQELLIIHPHDLMRSGLKAIVGELGFHIEVFENWHDAYKIIKLKNLTPLIICDYHSFQSSDLAQVIDHHHITVLCSSHDQYLTLKNIKVFTEQVSAQILVSHFTKYAPTLQIDKMVRSVDLARNVKNLSPRQYQILELMATGLLNKQIAWELGLTEGTIKSHVSSILEKMKCNRRTQAIADFLQFQNPRRT
jgi:DNA-binding NarL/FixJ family response regulator